MQRQKKNVKRNRIVQTIKSTHKQGLAIDKTNKKLTYSE